MRDSHMPAPVFVFIARSGLAARALVYFLIAGLLAWSALFSTHSEEGVSPGQAFKWVETQPGGILLLLGIGIGLMMYALWRFEQGVFDLDRAGSDARGYIARAGMLASGLGYGLVGFAAFSVAADRDDGGNGGTTETVARWLLEQPFGALALVLVGLCVVAIGGAQGWRALKGQWKNHIDLSGWAGKTSRIIAFAILGRGMMIGLVGLFLIVSGMNAQPDDAKGISSLLGWLRWQPYGFWLFLAGALAIGGYGVYSAVQAARYRF